MSLKILHIFKQELRQETNPSKFQYGQCIKLYNKTDPRNDSIFIYAAYAKVGECFYCELFFIYKNQKIKINNSDENSGYYMTITKLGMAWDCLLMKAAFFVTGVIFKVIPLTLLIFLIGYLVRALRRVGSCE